MLCKMVTKFVVFVVAAILSSVTFAQDYYTTSTPDEKCFDPNNYDLRATNFTNEGVTVLWYADTNCTHRYQVCWNASTDSVIECHNVTFRTTWGEYFIPYSRACRELDITLDALPVWLGLDETVSSTITVVTAPAQVPVVTLSQPYGKASLNVKWLYGIPELYCSSGFVVTWCNAGGCNSKSVDGRTYSYDIENLQFCKQYSVSVKAEDIVSRHTSKENVQIASVERIGQLNVTEIGSGYVVLSWASRGVTLCTRRGKLCYLRSYVASGKVTPTCYSDLKSTDTFLTVIGLQPSTAYNFTYESNYTNSTIHFQELSFVQTAAEVPFEGP